MKITKFKTKNPFDSLFDIDKNLLNTIKENMEEVGYDDAFPIVIWNDIVIDGHTRLQAAKLAGIIDIPVEEKDFEDEQEALEYAIHNQRNRRNLTPAELLRCIEALDERRERKGQGVNQYNKESAKNLEPNYQQPEPPSRNRTAELLGIGQSKVSAARVVLDTKDPVIRKQIEIGEKSINKAAIEIREENKIQKQESLPTFNQTNDNIEWAKWSWNPVTGCKMGCEYCYARDIANRFYPQKFEPTFHKNRLPAPENTKIPKGKEKEPGWNNVFVCSMADLFGDWVPDEWIEKILDVIAKNPKWNFLLLTKFPKRYLEWEFPKNTWLGATADNQKRADIAMEVFSKLDHPIKFLSCEPLMESIILNHIEALTWLILGGRSASSGMIEGQPEWEWVESLLNQAHSNGIGVYFKPNLIVRPKEYPE